MHWRSARRRKLRALAIFPRVAIRHSNLSLANFGERPECVQERHGTDRHWDEFGDIREKSLQLNPIPGRGMLAKPAHSVLASWLSLPILVQPHPLVQGPAWFLFCL